MTATFSPPPAACTPATRRTGAAGSALAESSPGVSPAGGARDLGGAP
jgi:hypothetical protein